MPPSKHTTFSLNPLWSHYVALAVTAFSLALGIARYILDLPDPLHCNTLLNHGQWLDSRLKNWQPEGCMLHSYGSKDIALCLARRQLNFIGDSTTRELFFSLAHTADPELPSGPPNNSEKHANYSYISHAGTQLSFIWDPFLNTSHTKNIVSSRDAQGSTGLGVAGIRRPALLVLGSGLWYLRYADTSGGLPAWEKAVEDIVGKLARTRTKPADELVFLPVSEVVSSKLSKERALSIHGSDIDAMNSDLAHRIRPLSSSTFPAFSTSHSLPIGLPLVFNRMLLETETVDGLHYSEKIRDAQVNVLLNMMCNDVLPKTFPQDKTCCRRYPMPSIPQVAVLSILVSWAPLVWLFSERFGFPMATSLLLNRALMGASVTIGLAVGLLFSADRTGLWLKEQKQFDPWNFGLVTLSGLAVGLATLKQGDKDIGFLNRQQTDEWKGWMQIVILIYHYFGASKISGIYNPVRVLVASYLFMTGYGHTTYYMKKADFGFLRVAQVMVRLNLFTLVLAYTMNTDYVFYYFSPLVSFWFLIIYTTMAIGSQHNERVVFLTTKIFISMGLTTLCMKQQWIMQDLFEVLEWSCGIHWSARESAFRINLDLWIVYAGMLAAIAVVKFRELRLADHPKWPLVHKTSVGASLLILAWYFAFELTQESKFTYNLWHPYVSVFPIGAFVVLRNANPILRSAHSRAFAFIGGCSLETFVIQYHFWLAADTKGVLLVLLGTRWRPVNMVLTTVMFIYLSHRVSGASAELTAWFCGATPPPVLPTTAAVDQGTNGRTEEAIPLTSRDQPEGDSGHKDGREADVQTVPDTPSRRERWLDRLADGPRVSEQPIEKSWTLGVKSKLAGVGVLMWALNMMWSNP